MSIKIYIVRHGQPLSAEIEQDIPNSPLGPRGRKQAILAAAEVEKLGGVDCIYSSTLYRALDTAKAFYDWFQVPWYVWPALCETGRSQWPRLREMQNCSEELADDCCRSGVTEKAPELERDYPRERYPLLGELQEQYPHIVLSQPFDWPDKWWLPLVDETREAAYARARKVIDAIEQQHGNGDCRVALVGHGAFGSVLMTVLAEAPPCDHNRFRFAHTAFSCVELREDGTVQVVFADYIAHLYPHYLTGY